MSPAGGPNQVAWVSTVTTTSVRAFPVRGEIPRAVPGFLDRPRLGQSVRRAGACARPAEPAPRAAKLPRAAEQRDEFAPPQVEHAFITMDLDVIAYAQVLAARQRILKLRGWERGQIFPPGLGLALDFPELVPPRTCHRLRTCARRALGGMCDHTQLAHIFQAGGML